MKQNFEGIKLSLSSTHINFAGPHAFLVGLYALLLSYHFDTHGPHRGPFKILIVCKEIVYKTVQVISEYILTGKTYSGE